MGDEVKCPPDANLGRLDLFTQTIQCLLSQIRNNILLSQLYKGQVRVNDGSAVYSAWNSSGV